MCPGRHSREGAQLRRRTSGCEDWWVLHALLPLVRTQMLSNTRKQKGLCPRDHPSLPHRQADRCLLRLPGAPQAASLPILCPGWPVAVAESAAVTAASQHQEGGPPEAGPCPSTGSSPACSVPGAQGSAGLGCPLTCSPGTHSGGQDPGADACPWPLPCPDSRARQSPSAMGGQPGTP